MHARFKYLALLLILTVTPVVIFLYSTGLLELVSSPALILSLFFTVTATLHVFIYFKNLNEIEWKLVDYAWLLLALVGTLGIGGDIDRYMSNQFLHNLEIPRLESAYSDLYHLLEDQSSPNSIYCQNHMWELTEFGLTKEEFDDFKLLKENQCQEIRSIFALLPRETSYPYANLDEFRLVNGAIFYDDQFFYKIYERYLNNYQNQYQVYKNLENKSDRTGFLFYLFLFSPVLLCTGLALRITKATGEILLMKNKK